MEVCLTLFRKIFLEAVLGTSNFILETFIISLFHLIKYNLIAQLQGSFFPVKGVALHHCPFLFKLHRQFYRGCCLGCVL